MISRLPVIVNRRGGAASAAGEAVSHDIDAAFAAVRVEALIRLVDGAEIMDAARSFAGEPLLVVGGGDGSIGCAAQARIEGGDATLAILPLGTRNHFARELGIPLDLPGAAAVAAGSEARRIDLGQINGVMFVNNASVGFYPLLVRWREAEGRRRGWPKWLATLPACWEALRRIRHHRMYLRMDGAEQVVRTPLLFVGNNRYKLEAGQIGQRHALDDGMLSVFAVAASSRMGLVWFALRILFGLADPARDFAALGECQRLTVASRSRAIDVAVDGEVLRMRPPLEFTLLPQALEVRAPVPLPGGP